MITKCLLVCLCVTAALSAGLGIVRKRRARVRYYASCVRLAETLLSDISFRRTPLLPLLQSFAETDTSELKTHIAVFCAHPYEPFVPTGKLLKADEKKTVSEFFGMLGTSDAATQLSALEGYKQRFTQLYETENEYFLRNGKVTVKLSVLLGLAVGILLL